MELDQVRHAERDASTHLAGLLDRADALGFGPAVTGEDPTPAVSLPSAGASSLDHAFEFMTTRLPKVYWAVCDEQTEGKIFEHLF